MIRNLIKLCKITLSGDKSTKAPVVQVDCMGAVNDALLLQPYGLTSMPPDDAMGVMFSINGQMANKAVIAFDLSGRKNTLKAGESFLQNTVRGTFIGLTDDGKITIQTNMESIDLISSTAVNITAPSCNIQANTAITGSFTVNGKNVSDTHSHSDPQGGNTGGVV